MADLDASDDAYELAEAAYLAALRSGAERAVLSGLASSVARAASEWNSAAHAALHAGTGAERGELDLLTERTEVLDEL